MEIPFDNSPTKSDIQCAFQDRICKWDNQQEAGFGYSVISYFRPNGHAYISQCQSAGIRRQDINIYINM